MVAGGTLAAGAKCRGCVGSTARANRTLVPVVIFRTTRPTMRIIPLLAVIAIAQLGHSQEFSHMVGTTSSFPTTLGQCGSEGDMAISPGFRITLPKGDRFSVGVGAAHEWRSVRSMQETADGTIPLSDVSGRAFLMQATGHYRLFTCASRCATTMGLMLGTDVSMPYRTNSLRYAADGSEGPGEQVDRRGWGGGVAVRAGMRFSVPLCDRMGFFMEPQVLYRAVLDRTDLAARANSGASLSGDRFAMAMQGGLFMRLSCPGRCPLTGAGE